MFRSQKKDLKNAIETVMDWYILYVFAPEKNLDDLIERYFDVAVWSGAYAHGLNQYYY